MRTALRQRMGALLLSPATIHGQEGQFVHFVTIPSSELHFVHIRVYNPFAMLFERLAKP